MPTPQEIQAWRQQMIKKGIKPSHVDQYIQSKLTQTQTPVAPIQEEKNSLGGFVGNVFKSGGNLVKNVAQAVAHPIQTTKTLGRIGLGAAEKLVPGEQGAETDFNAVADFYKQRYGSLDALKETAYNDPVGLAADLSTLLGGTGLALKGAGLASKASSLSKAGQIATTTARVTDPLSALGTLRRLPGFQNLASSLEKLNLRLTPIQRAKLGTKVDDMAKFVTEHVPVGTPSGRAAVVTDIYNATEDVLQKNLQQLDSVTQGIPKPNLIARLEQIPDTFRNDTALYPQVQRQVAEVIETVKSSQPDVIPPSVLNISKRSFSKKAYDKLGIELRSEVQNAISEAYMTLIEDSLKDADILISIPDELQPIFKAESLPISEFNRQYGVIINTKKFLKLAETKPEIGFFGRMVGGGIGAVTGKAFGGYTGAVLGGAVGPTITNTVVTPLRAATSKVLSRPLRTSTPRLTPASRIPATQQQRDR